MQRVHIGYIIAAVSKYLVQRVLIDNNIVYCTQQVSYVMYVVLYMQRFLIVSCTEAVSLLFSALHAKRPYYVLHISSVLII